MYSSVLVGLMNSVDSFSANGIRQTSQPATSCGSSAYGCWPSQWMLGRRGSGVGSIFTTGPTMTICQRRIGVGERGDEVEVEALVDDAEEAQARRGDGALQRVGARHRLARVGRARRVA